MATYVEASQTTLKAARWFSAGSVSNAVEIAIPTLVPMPEIHAALHWTDATTRSGLADLHTVLGDAVLIDLEYHRPPVMDITAVAHSTNAAHALVDNAYCVSLSTCARFGHMPTIILRGDNGAQVSMKLRAAGREIPTTTTPVALPTTAHQ
jgi:hypothetical protein